MNITIIAGDHELFNNIVKDIEVMIPVYPFNKPHIYNIDWHNRKVEMFADGEYYNIFIAALKPYIINKRVIVKSSLKHYPLAIYEPNNVPNDNWLITI